MSASFVSVMPPDPSRTRREFVDSANPRRMPVSAAEKKASTKTEWAPPSGERDPTMIGYLEAATVPKPAPVSRHDPVAILDRKLNLRV